MNAGQQSPDLFARIAFDDITLLVPQHDVHTLESMLDVAAEPNAVARYGTLTMNGEACPVYCLSASLETLRHPADDNRICVLLEHEGVLFGVACRSVGTLARNAVELFSLPGCMCTVDTVVTALALEGEDVMCVTSASALAGYLVGLDATFTLHGLAPAHL